MIKSDEAKKKGNMTCESSSWQRGRLPQSSLVALLRQAKTQASKEVLPVVEKDVLEIAARAGVRFSKGLTVFVEPVATFQCLHFVVFVHSLQTKWAIILSVKRSRLDH